MSTATPKAGPSRLMMIVVIAVSGVLLLTVVALVFLLIGQNVDDADNASATSTPTLTESATPTTTATATAPNEVEQESDAPAPDTSTRFTSFNAPTTVMCDNGDEDNQPPKPEIQVSWSSANAVQAWYTSSNEDAVDDQYMQIPLSGDQGDLTDEHLFPCFHDQTADYTITLLGPNGEHVSKHWTVTNIGDQ